MDELLKRINNLSEKEKELFYRIFEIEIEEAQLTLPSAAQKTFDPSVEHQTIMLIKNKWTGESISYNAWRSKRPKPKSEDLSVLKDTRDDFEHVHKKMPADEFGYLENDFGTTAENIAKVKKYHSLVVFKNPFSQDIGPQDIKGCFNLAETWFQKADEKTGGFKNGMVLWNSGYRSAATILHPHFQLIYPAHVSGRSAMLEQAAHMYQKECGYSYWDDFKKIHRALGLAKNNGHAEVIIPLVQYKDDELYIFAKNIEKSTEDLGTIMYAYKKLHENFNMFFYRTCENELPLGFAISRGSSAQKSSDIGALELYSFSIVESDPFMFANRFFA